ncbi:hypothetical protein Tfer_2757 [Thermincola ferriacetica]|uniref:Uncharacterized protein n=1 Tax=Thermincola ferriacetica TaxID=281456 RepID=A0A0L6VZN1_9FIRM|nr:hypothetical protein [Thermincola ferriacetica]KNZ68666.1 hypothetical protein Tfer_2757 [Thermincola ferriacetica]
MNVAVDICNTISHINAALAERGYNTKVYPSPDLPPGFFRSAAGLAVFMAAKPLPFAVEGVWQVYRSARETGGRLVYLTARPREARFVTRRWLELHGFPCPDAVVFAGNKAEAARRLGIGLAFEDDPVQIQALNAAGIKVLAVEQPYNRHLIGPMVFPVKWQEWRRSDAARTEYLRRT